LKKLTTEATEDSEGEEKKRGKESKKPLFFPLFLILPPCNSVFSVVFILPLP
jgi:hypothetical protein